MPRPTPTGAARSRVIHYIAVFSDSGETHGQTRVDYLLVSNDSTEESLGPSAGTDSPHRDTE
jgi:hypothetical protein